MKKTIENFIGSLYATSSSSDPKDKKGKDAGGVNSNLLNLIIVDIGIISIILFYN